ncbi:sarcosine oxidase subunit alpha [Pelagibius sp. Alg239-R121]|uniref:sarcosine oxidase subunit alpha n=1 Tax=Pelagibius sp. Alg239-R121 TaxID=2993448 RepID=UPI0024A65B8C|nr:sarcosine oxidase subunit alpha [Pelagibius sp. Alg239-R121]
MPARFRLTQGGLIDRSKPVSFQFNGKVYLGFEGDTLASALIANGVHLVGRSFKYHRPRGIMSAGAEEANALIQVGEGARSDPNLRATQIELVDGLVASSQNCWPSVEFDVSIVNNFASRLLPSGFYYKTFMWPASFWMTYESAIRKAAGLGKAPEGPDPDSYDKTFAHCDVLVVGAGPSGLTAALSAGRAGARVILAEQDNALGGDLLSEADAEIQGQPALEWVEGARAELEGLENVRILTRTQCYGYFDHNFIGLMQNLTDHLPQNAKPASLPRHRLWKLRAKQVLLATGAIERPLVFSDNDRPGIMLASACRTYVNRYGVKPGKKAVIFTNNDGAYAAALDLHKAGIHVAAIVDLRSDPEGPMTEQAREAGLRILGNHAVIATAGDKRVKAVLVAPLSEDGEKVYGGGEKIDCDLVAVSGGWNPTVHLHSQSRGKIVFDDDYACFVPGTPAQESVTAGACSGNFGLGACLTQGHDAGIATAAKTGFKAKGRKRAPPKAEDRNFLPARWMWLVPGDKPLGHGGKHFVDVQNDVTAADLHLALREGYRSIEHVKRYTTTGMGTDQGKTSNVNAIGIVAGHFGCPIPNVGVTTFRPPYTPVTFGVFAGRDVGDLLDPVRKTPMHALHEHAGAAFEDVGQWKRPWYFPIAGEDMHQAVNREVKACRDSLGVMDASTLGKIDIQGKDAAEFLNRIYTNAWSQLKVGACRYGLMLGEDGMVMDDGVTSRLGENHFLMTTTTGNAAPVLGHLEEYLQTEWPELEVYLTSVTEQFATISLAGPNARNLLAELTDIDLSAEAFPFMTLREGTAAGIPARVFRISFTGDLSYEINVPASYGAALWQTVMTAGEKYGITPYGTEAMHVLRAEKGFIIVGQETDGSVTPFDLGMDWIVSKKKDFVGRRSLFRADMSKDDRKQLVGLLTDVPEQVLPEGAQLVEKVEDKPPMKMLGHVTSSYHSPNVGRSIAMALIKGGRARMGSKLYAPLADGKVVTCTVTGVVFYDKEGERTRG